MNLKKVDFGYLENQLNERLENLGKWNVDINDEESLKKLQRILDLLDEEDDVQAVYTNTNN